MLIGAIYYAKDATKGQRLWQYMLRALPLAKEIGDSSAMGTISENIGEIYAYL
jgi:hypothetical protein